MGKLSYGLAQSRISRVNLKVEGICLFAQSVFLNSPTARSVIPLRRVLPFFNELVEDLEIHDASLGVRPQLLYVNSSAVLARLGPAWAPAGLSRGLSRKPKLPQAKPKPRLSGQAGLEQH